MGDCEHGKEIHMEDGRYVDTRFDHCPYPICSLSYEESYQTYYFTGGSNMGISGGGIQPHIGVLYVLNY